MGSEIATEKILYGETVLFKKNQPAQVEIFDTKKSKAGERLAERIFQYIVSNIIGGEFAPGEKISQRKLASRLGISQVPVREAMEKLQQCGWIERFPQRGTYVKSFTTQEINDVYQIREMCEGEAIRILAKKITPPQLAEMKEIIESLKSLCKEHDSENYVVADTQFHTKLVAMVGNQRLDQIYRSVLLQTRSFMLMGAARVPFAWGGSMENDSDPTSHGPIYKALENRDGELAERLIRRHIRAGCDLAVVVKKWLLEMER